MNNTIKYVVTDPCYILDNDVWSKCCEVFDKYKDDEFMYQRFDEAVSKALIEYTGYILIRLCLYTHNRTTNL